MKHRLSLVAFTLGAVVLTALVASHLGRRTPESAVPGPVAEAPAAAAVDRPTGPGCRFVPGDRAAWRIEADRTITADGAAPVTDRFVGTLAVRVESAAPRALHLAARFVPERFESPALAPEARNGFDAPFRLIIDAACRVHAVETAAFVTPEAAAYLRTLVLETQFIVPVGAGAVWSLDQTDGAGTLAARYTRNAYTVGREKREYRGETAEMLRFTGSNGSAVFAADGRGLLRFDTDDTVQTAGFRIRTVVHGRVTDPVEVGAVGAAVAAAPQPEREARRELKPYELSAEERALAPEAAVTRYAERAAADENPGVFEPRRYLVAAVRADPAVAAAAARALIAGQFDDRTSSMAMLALSHADTPAAATALARVGAAGDAPIMRRMQAASYLGTVPTATPAVFEHITSLLRSPVGTVDERTAVADAARLALGAVVHTSAGSTDAATAAARAAAHEALRGDLRAGDAAVVVSAVEAVGNSGDPALLSLTAPLMADADRNLRAAAVHALRRRPPAEVEAAVRARVGVERDVFVLESLRSALHNASIEADNAQLDPTTASALAARLAVEPDAAVRVALVDLLGACHTRNKRSTAADEALAAHYTRETDARVRVRIGRYLPFNKLPPAVR